MKARPAVFLALLISTLFLVLTLLPALSAKDGNKPVEKEFPASFDRVWSAALRAIQQRGEPILTSDKASGVIASDYRFEGKKKRYKFTILLTAVSEGKTKVSVRCLIEGQKGFLYARSMFWGPRKSDGKREKKLLEDVGHQLEALPSAKSQ